MSARSLNDMTCAEINALIFEGASTLDLRGMRDRLTDDEIMSLPDHPCYRDWPASFTDWIWEAIDEIAAEEPPAKTAHQRAAKEHIREEIGA